MKIRNSPASPNKSIVNPHVINGEIVAFLPPEIEDDTQKLVESTKQEKIRLKNMWDAERKHEEIVKALKGHKGQPSRKNHLEVSQNCEFLYTNEQRKKYQGRFGKETNAFQLLSHLAKKPHTNVTFSELGGILKLPRRGSELPNEERRVRDTVQHIRKIMKLPKGEMLKIDYGVELICGSTFI